VQVATLGDLDRATLRMIRQAKGGDDDGSDIRLFALRDPATRDGVGLKAGALLVREWNGAPHANLLERLRNDWRSLRMRASLSTSGGGRSRRE
jgi:hypothetical protein